MNNEELLDNVDAMVFSGDALLDDEFRKSFNEYLDRWKKKVESYNNLKEELSKSEG